MKFKQNGIRRVERLAAVDGITANLPSDWSGTRGAYGCLQSHLQAVREAQTEGLASVLIFEDDVEFAAGFQETFGEYIGQVPQDWEMLYFGALHMEDPIAISENVSRIRRAYSTYAYALRSTIFDAFIEINGRANTPVDVNNLALQSRRKCYCFVPNLAWVESGESDVQERQNDHWYLRESLVVHGKSMDDLLNRTTVIVAYNNQAANESRLNNLLFLTRFYRRRLPGIRVVVVELGNVGATAARRELPGASEHLLLQPEGPPNIGLAFNAGMKLCRPEDQFVVFSDSNVFIEEWDICASLRMCERYDCTTGFTSIIDLSPQDSMRLRGENDMLMRWFDAKKYCATRKPDSYSGFCVFNLQGFRAAGGWQCRPPQAPGPRLSVERGTRLKVFQSPNYALRMADD